MKFRFQTLAKVDSVSNLSVPVSKAITFLSKQKNGDLFSVEDLTYALGYSSTNCTRNSLVHVAMHPYRQMVGGKLKDGIMRGGKVWYGNKKTIAELSKKV